MECISSSTLFTRKSSRCGQTYHGVGMCSCRHVGPSNNRVLSGNIDNITRNQRWVWNETFLTPRGLPLSAIVSPSRVNTPILFTPDSYDTVVGVNSYSVLCFIDKGTQAAHRNVIWRNIADASPVAPSCLRITLQLRSSAIGRWPHVTTAPFW